MEFEPPSAPSSKKIAAKAALKALNTSEERYRRLFETAYDGILILNFDSGKVIDANPYILDMLGVSLDTVIGKELWEIGIFSDIKASKKAFKVLKKDGYIRYEDLPLETSHGIQREVEFISNAYIDGKDKVIQCNIRDISARVITEKRLKLEMIHSAQIINNAREAFISIDSHSNILEWNPSAEKLFGYTRSAVLGEKLAKLIIPNTHQSKHMEGIKQYFKTGTHKILNSPVELTACHKNNNIIPIELSIVAEGTGENTVFNAFIRDLSERHKAQESLAASYLSLRKSLLGTISVLSKAIELRDPYTAGHQVRVSQLSGLIAEEMKLDNDTIEGIRMGALIHDIGKIMVPSELLTKPSHLSDIEYALIKEHSAAGYKILKDIDFPWPLADIAHQHHERIDGSGYPQGLMGEQICQEAKIVAVADVVEAMSSHRPYRPGLGIDAALNEIREHQNSFYDEEIVKACIKVFADNKYQL